MAACSTGATAWGASTQESLLQDDDLLIHSSAAEVDKTMAELRELGIDRVRLSVIWRDLAPEHRPGDPSDPRGYQPAKFDHLDTAVRTAERHGIGVLLNLRGAIPRWAREMRPPQHLRDRDAYRPDPDEFQLFVQMVGRRYSGSYADENDGRAVLPRVTMWSVWNEPNWGGLLQPQSVRDPKTRRLHTVAPVVYRRLHRAATTGLRVTGHRDDAILIGETAPVGNTKLGELSHLKPLRFLRDLFCLDRRLRPLPRGQRYRELECWDFKRRGMLRATGYAHHPYSVMDPPGEPSADPDFARLADADALARVLDGAGRAGRLPRGLPLWYTEYGYQTAPPDPYRGIAPEQHAAWLVEAEHIAWANPRVAAHAQFLLRDDEPNALWPLEDRRHWGTYQSGLRYADGAAKPAYASYRLPLLAPEGLRPGRPLELWGMVRPGANGTAQRVRIQFRASEGEAWTALPDEVHTDGQGYFEVTVSEARAGQYRFEWLKPDSPAPAPAENDAGPRRSAALDLLG